MHLILCHVSVISQFSIIKDGIIPKDAPSQIFLTFLGIRTVSRCLVYIFREQGVFSIYGTIKVFGELNWNSNLNLFGILSEYYM